MSAHQSGRNAIENTRESSTVIDISRDRDDTLTACRDQLLCDREVALRYKVKKQTIWRWARSSETFPKPIKVEGSTRWSENELDEHDRKLKEAR